MTEWNDVVGEPLHEDDPMPDDTGLREAIEAREEAENAVALAITHEHGVDTSAHTSREAAEAALLAYVKDWWATEAGEGVPMPEDPSEAIQAYFMEHTPQEDYEITVAP